MRKQTKLVAVLSAAALLAIGASMTSFAATGWTEENGEWVYYDRDGYQVTESWKKSGNYYYYLDEDGVMAKDKLIENGDDNGNLYYVDASGVMVTNRWVELENEDYYDSDDDEEPATNWYYFQSSGKAYKTSGATSFKTINGKKYAFDENGKMLYGWVNGNSERVKDGDSSFKAGVYYCGDENDGARVTSDWRKLYVGDQGPSDSEDDEYWFYFQPNGKKLASKNNKTINGKKYSFDDDGMMITSWHGSTIATASQLTGFYGDSDDGAMKKGWFKEVPSENVDNSAYNDDSAKWFYANNDGTLVVSQVKTIGGKKYAFDPKGEMLSGLIAMEVNSDNKILAYEKIDKEAEVGDDYADTVEDVGNGNADVYFFGSGDDGSLKTGNQNVTVDGESYQFTFGKTGSNKGKGLHGKESNAIYIYGKKIKAESDYRYQGVDETDGTLLVGSDAIGHYLINTSGSIMKGTTYKDSEGRIYTLDNNDKVKEWKWSN